MRDYITKHSTTGEVYMQSKTLYQIGFWSAVFAVIEVSIFSIMLILSFWFDTNIISFIACFLLAPTIVAMIASVHCYTSQEKKIWSQLSLSFSIIYAIMCIIVYYLQISIVRINTINYSPEILKLIAFIPGSVIFVIDNLGYAFLALSTLFLAPVFSGNKLEKRLKYILIVHGLLFIPALILPCLRFFMEMFQTSEVVQTSINYGNFALLFWCLLFVPIPLLLAAIFKRSLKTLK